MTPVSKYFCSEFFSLYKRIQEKHSQISHLILFLQHSHCMIFRILKHLFRFVRQVKTHQHHICSFFFEKSIYDADSRCVITTEKPFISAFSLNNAEASDCAFFVSTAINSYILNDFPLLRCIARPEIQESGNTVYHCLGGIR